MNLSSQNMMIIVIFFCFGILVMIPFFIAQSKRKKKEASFVSANSHQAVLHLYGEKVIIDGTKIKDMDYIRGEGLQFTVALLPGTHTVSAKYGATEVKLGRNVEYSTPEPIESEIELEAGHEYSLGLYFDSPEKGNSSKKNPRRDVYTQLLDISGGGFGARKNAYIICYEEK